MNYDFLKSYNIPVARQNANNHYVSSSHSTMEGAYGTYSMQSTQNIPTVNSAYYGYGASNVYNNSYQTSTIATENSSGYQYSERSLLKQSSLYVPHKTIYKRKHNGVGGGSAAKKDFSIAELTNDGKLAMFLGRDESYPDELNSLIHPLTCDLCNIKMNSRAIAKDHYESKVHDKHISSWLFKNYTEKGLNPPAIKRFTKTGPIGPDAFYCQACDLKLTSLTHANQHYAGKKHRLVITQRAKPSGAGFYNSEGKWVRTGTKATSNPSKDKRFGIGESFKFSEIESSIQNVNSITKDTVTNVADTTTTIESEVNLNSVCGNSVQDPALFCSICKVTVTSAVQMTMHLSGSKHTKKLKLAGLNPTSTYNNLESQMDLKSTITIMDNVLLSAIKDEAKLDPIDLSIYRTPSGQYYCKTCNISMSHLPGLEQHLKGKRHLRKQTEEKAMSSLTAKKN